MEKKFEIKKLAKVILDHKRDIAVSAGTVGIIMLTKAFEKYILTDHNKYDFEVGWDDGGNKIGFRINKTDIFGRKHKPNFVFWSIENTKNIVDHINMAIEDASK